MFDLSFGKLFLVMIIALIVLGPARLPEAIKTVAGWIKALRRLSATVQLELNKELRLQELQDSLKNAEKSGLDTISPEIKSSIDDLKRVAESIQKDFYDTGEQIKKTINSVSQDNQLPTASSEVGNNKIISTSTAIGKEDDVR